MIRLTLFFFIKRFKSDPQVISVGRSRDGRDVPWGYYGILYVCYQS